MTTFWRKLRLWRWRLALRLAAVRQNLYHDFWKSISVIFWQFPVMREGYYAYRENCWRNAHAALPFYLWLATAGWNKGGDDGRS